MFVKKEKSCGCIIYKYDKNKRMFLLIHQKHGDYIGFPKGHVELDESEIETAIREVKEETNLDVSLTKFIGIFSNPFMRWKEKDYAKVFTFAFTAKVIGGELKVNDHESLLMKYFAYEELPPLHSMDTIEIIEQYYNFNNITIEGERYDG